TASIIQPLIAPLYQGCRTAHEVLSAMLGEPERKPYDIIREYWQRRVSNGGQEPPIRLSGGASSQQASSQQTASQQAASQQASPQQASSQAAAPASSAPTATPAQAPSQEFERFWRKSVHDGVIAGTALPLRTLATKISWPAQVSSAQRSSE